MRVYLARKQRKYILVGNCEPGQWETIAASNEVTGIVNKAKEIVAGMKMYHADLTIENFNYLWQGKNPDEDYVYLPFEGVNTSGEYLRKKQKTKRCFCFDYDKLVERYEINLENGGELASEE